jgi:ferredoxin
VEIVLNQTGIPTLNQIKSKRPSENQLIKAKAITECFEAIPCNPCETSCPFGAITIGEDINTPPKVDFDKCTGCGICVYSCPGLAIHTLEVLEDYLVFQIPFELLPKPEKGDIMAAVNRSGEVIGKCEILKVSDSPKQDKTTLLKVKVDKKLIDDFITVRWLS